jgi:hypothetical protein
MEKNYTHSSDSGMPSQQQKLSQGVSMKTKLLLAKIGLAICIIVLIVAKSMVR